MRTYHSILALLSVCVLTLSLAACGGGGGSASTATSSTSSSSGSSGSSGSSSTASNVAAITVESAVSGRRPNLPFVSVTICIPGTSTCQTIDHVIVDTGSVGLRLLSSAVTLSLPSATTASNQIMGECLQFVSSYSWGAVRQATYSVGGESTTAATPVQIIGDSGVPATAPSSCTATGSTAANSVSSFGANGLLGVGLFKQDCGASCVTSASPNQYYGCTSATGTCSSTTATLAKQVAHPATLFSTDNNGSIIVMPTVDAAGAVTASGQLIFGIGTQSNNAISASTVINTTSDGRFTVKYGTSTLTDSFLDSGSNGLFFNDSSITNCSSTSIASAFFCPASTLSLSATFASQTNTGQSSAVSFDVANALTMLTGNSYTNNAAPGLAGPGSLNTFDMGFPFFYGRSVYTVIEDASTSVGTGPFVAF